MSSCSPPAPGRGISRMPGSAERVGSPAPQVTNRATKNGTRCPTRPGADSLHPCPSRRPAPHRVPRTGPNPSPPPQSSSQRWLGSSNYRAQQAPRETPACAGVTVGGNCTTGWKAGRCSRRGAETAEKSRPPYRCDPSPRSISSGTLHRTNHLRALRASARKPLGLPHKKDVLPPVSRRRRIVHFVHFRARSG